MVYTVLAPDIELRKVTVSDARTISSPYRGHLVDPESDERYVGGGVTCMHAVGRALFLSPSPVCVYPCRYDWYDTDCGTPAFLTLLSIRLFISDSHYRTFYTHCCPHVVLFDLNPSLLSVSLLRFIKEGCHVVFACQYLSMLESIAQIEAACGTLLHDFMFSRVKDPKIDTCETAKLLFCNSFILRSTSPNVYHILVQHLYR